MNTNKQVNITRLVTRFAAILLLVLTAIAFNSAGATSASMTACEDFCLTMSAACATSGGTSVFCAAEGPAKLHICSYNTIQACVNQVGYVDCGRVCGADQNDFCTGAAPFRTCSIAIP
jgi:hypothetical protein